jgi:hypothetical protein
MKFPKIAGILLAAACLQSIVAQSGSDTIWFCRDTGQEDVYMHMYLSDTFPDNRDSFAMVDTGDAIDGMYINFNYQFGHPNPGYAGYKIFWDYGQSTFWVAKYDSMVLWHKGPLPGHKVRMVWAQGSAGCGTPINYEYLGEFKSSSTWKRESFSFPSGFVKNGLFELRMLIYNDSIGGDTSSTSAPGNLKIDNMFFLKTSTGIRNPKPSPSASGGPLFFSPRCSGQVKLTIFSLQGEQIFQEAVDVTEGKQYNIGQFARKNSNLPARWIHCVQISGAGVNITAKLLH